MKDKVLIAGCGDVGNALALRLLEDGCEVWGIRRRIEALAPGVAPWRIDLADPQNLARVPESGLDSPFHHAPSSS